MNPSPGAFILSRQAKNYLKRLDKDTRLRIQEALLKALDDPIGTSDRLVNCGDERKIRIGGFRILFRIDTDARRILVDTILPRGDVYKHIRR